MRKPAGIRSLARDLARGAAPWTGTGTPLDLAGRLPAQALRDIPLSLWNELDARTEHDPNAALALAYVLNALVVRDPNPALGARAQLALIRALNRCGEFHLALGYSRDAAQAAETRGDTPALAFAQLEAAWASSYLGHLAFVQAALAQVLTLEPSLPTLPLRDDARRRREWISARVLREQGDYFPALDAFQTLYREFSGIGESHQAHRVLREIGHTRARIDPADALPPLQKARAYFKRTRSPVEVAHCEYFMAQALTAGNQFKRAAAYLTGAQKTFRKYRIRFFDSICDLDLGYLCWYLNRFNEMLDYSRHAHALLLDLQATQELSTCRLNIGVALMELNRYAEAIPYFEEAMADALASGRRTKAAQCLINLARIYDIQGQYARALQLLQRAQAIYAAASRQEWLIECELRMARVYLHLNEPAQALAIVEHAHALAKQGKLKTRAAQCELYRAQVSLRRGNRSAAALAIRHARANFSRAGQAVYAAFCDRLLAEIPSPRRARGLARLAQSRATFLANGQAVDAALCDLVRGELELRWRDWEGAQGYLKRAERIFDKNYPDKAARIQYGLARVARAHNDPRRARKRLLKAAQLLAQVRSTLGLESLSNSFFQAQARILQEGLDLARVASAPHDALALIEAGKAQTFLQFLPAREWRLTGANDRLTALQHRERALYDALTQKRAQLLMGLDSGDTMDDPEERVWRRRQAQRRELRTMARDYEALAQELRLARTSFAGVPLLDPFSLHEFRASAKIRWGDDWVALDYFFAGRRLYLVVVTPNRLNLHAISWGDREQRLLEQVSALQPDMRELVYNGTLRGHPVPRRENLLGLLGDVLLPPEIEYLSPDGTLLISPHGLLHRFPFQALERHGSYLGTRVTVGYIPNLQAFAQVSRSKSENPSDKVLVCGARKFQGRAPDLRHTRREVQEIARLYPEAALLWQKEAARERLSGWNQTGQLGEFGILHFAAHATVETDTPHLSGILLGEGELTVTDITDLRLNARLVTLSACAGNTGKGGSGDEWVSLTRAFLYAGARALVASLWQVDDRSTTQLMTGFYRHLRAGRSIARALRAAQEEMIRAGASPYQWAPFVAVGAV